MSMGVNQPGDEKFSFPINDFIRTINWSYYELYQRFCRLL